MNEKLSYKTEPVELTSNEFNIFFVCIPKVILSSVATSTYSSNYFLAKSEKYQHTSFYLEYTSGQVISSFGGKEKVSATILELSKALTVFFTNFYLKSSSFTM